MGVVGKVFKVLGHAAQATPQLRQELPHATPQRMISESRHKQQEIPRARIRHAANLGELIRLLSPHQPLHHIAVYIR
jgi:hypothetical protein